MTAQSLLVVGGRIQTVRKAAGLGLPVVSFQHRHQLFPEAAELAEMVVVADFTDWETLRPLILAAHERFHFARAISLTEAGLLPASRVNDLLDLGGTSYRANELLMDKWAMREHLATHPHPAVAPVAAALVTGEAAVRSFAEQHGYPVVVKPTTGTASVGLARVDGPAEIKPLLDRISLLRRGEHANAEFFHLDQFVVEEFVPGAEYSVETFSFGGRHVVITITEKLSLPNFIELGHAVPARLDPATEQALATATIAFLDTIGVVDGAGHTEFKLAPDGPRVIESHNRIGGDRIVDLVEEAYDIDLELYTVGWPFGLVPELPDRPQPRCAAATRFLTAEAGTVTDIKGADEVRAVPGVVDLDLAVGSGSTVRPLTDNWARVGQIVVTAPDTAAAVAACEQLADKVTIATT
jgi:biotin carboxylase